ncbi:RNA-directed DNA polymerase [Variovorax sp. W1I1]|nr:RNA-directed DNA polymerase [Variovorax sp. W1I1]
MAGDAYRLDQCALYKVRSKTRLAEILHVSVPVLLAFEKSSSYKVFQLPEQICEFTGKVTKARQVEEPKRVLKGLHERIRDLLARVCHPDYAHAAIKGRSYRSNAEFHKNSDVVATFHVKKFYPSTSEDAVFLFFLHQLKCAPDIAGLLSRLVCFRKVPDKLGCLPTGSPLSPLLSIYANKPMFDALAKLAQENGMKFTCYVDDLTFSGARIPIGLERRVTSIVKSHGHKMADEKTKIFGKNVPKHITGVVVHAGKVAVPFGRFRKARNIERAISAAPDKAEKIRLMQKLSGLLGEAAYLDTNYKAWATKSYRRLAFMRATPVVTFTGVPMERQFLATGTDGSTDTLVPLPGPTPEGEGVAPWE